MKVQIRDFSDDFFSVNKMAFLNKDIHNDNYDFNFRTNFNCRSVIFPINKPVVLHIGAIDNYAAVEAAVSDIGMRLLIPESEHLRSSTIEEWYPLLKEHTPITKVYDVFPATEDVLKDFSFPIFIKGNRQTNRHKKSQCIISTKKEYEKLKNEWYTDEILAWQKIVIREFIPLQTIDNSSFPDMVPISYEFRFFYFMGKCVAYGPYWNIGTRYFMCVEDRKEAEALANWAADQLSCSFVAIDLAKTASGNWIIIEVNDAQESGFNGVDPFRLWTNILDTVQDLI